MSENFEVMVCVGTGLAGYAHTVHHMDVAEGQAVTISVNGRDYVAVVMPEQELPIQVVTWTDTQGEDNITLSPPGVLVDAALLSPRGRCDTCGAPCDPETGDCTRDPGHQTAIEG